MSRLMARQVAWCLCELSFRYQGPEWLYPGWPYRLGNGLYSFGFGPDDR